MFLIYLIAGYWATGQTLYKNKIVVHEMGMLFLARLIYGMVLGWILIPVAIIRVIFHI